MKKLPLSFYLHNNVTEIAKQLLGKVLVTKWTDGTTQGRIVETEAYEGEIDKASHAYKGLTPRTKTMYAQGGTAYVYLCYGIHQMFNVVTGATGTPHAILIRAVEPIKGIDIMLARTGKIKLDNTLTRGPGNVGKAFGFHTSHCGMKLNGKQIFIADDGYKVLPQMVGASARIGVAYAAEHAEWHYRFYIKGNMWVSGKKEKEM